MNRRRFLGTLAGAAALGAGCAQVRARMPALDRIGVQLYTLRTKLREDFEGTLARVAQIGYREVEFAGYFERTPQQLRTALDDVGLAAPSAHVELAALRNDWQRTLEAAHVLGHRYLIVAWLPAEERKQLDGYKRLADWFNRAGERAREAGVRLGYHNHDYEFTRFDGQIAYDVFLAATDPVNVVQQMDLFWVVNGGGDPLDYIARFPGRFHSVHVKDRDAAGRMVDVGRGVIDFRGIFARAEQAGIRHYFVEHDEPPDPLASIRASYDYLRELEL